MKSITSKAQKLALSIKKSIKDHYLNDALLLKEIHDDKDIYDDELENYYYLTYKDYDKLRIIVVNIFNLIFHDLKNKKRKHMEKIINLMYIFNNTYLYYFTYPKNIYLYKFQRFVNNKLFIYYKDYVYKASIKPIKEIPIVTEGGSDYEAYDPIQLKKLPSICKRIRC